MSDKPKLSFIVEDFQDVQRELVDFGARDTEPSSYFDWLMRQAMAGHPCPEITPDRWQLFDQPGCKRAARRLTTAAHMAYRRLQAASLLEAKKLADWYGW